MRNPCSLYVGLNSTVQVPCPGLCLFSQLQVTLCWVAGRGQLVRNLPDLFNEQCWNSRAKHTSLEESGILIDHTHAKYPGSYLHLKDTK